MKNIFSDLINILDKLDEDREEILKKSRDIVRDCSVAIKSIHRGDESTYQDNIDKIKSEIKVLKSLVSSNSGHFYRHLKTPEQEYVEAVALYSIIQKNTIPSYIDLEVDALHYVLGLADVIGELRRHILDNIRLSKRQYLEDILDKMDELYTYLFSLDYPSGMTKDLRHKTDVARNIIERTRGDITLSIQMNKLIDLLDESTKNNK
ncbi:MAG: haloacid dehalogenase [Candidatus Lokiarchaeota archaeon]|nr:haloacid dehalogenase [Candidatus Lokiarchaeota archaeon]